MGCANAVTIEGFLAEKPRFACGDGSHLSLALECVGVDERGREETVRMEVRVNGKRAERVAPLLAEGDRIMVRGPLRSERIVVDGVPRARLYVLARSLRFPYGPTASAD